MSGIQMLKRYLCGRNGHLPVRREVYRPPLDRWWRERAKIRWFCKCGSEIWAYAGDV